MLKLLKEELREDAREAEDFLDVKLVNGMWGKDKHESMTSVATKGYGIKSTNIRLMQKTARITDEGVYKEANYLHGTGNYVITLKFLYQCARYLRAGNGIEKVISKAVKDSGISESGKGGEGSR